MSMTVSEMITSLRKRSGRGSGDLTDAVMLTYLNRAQERIAVAHTFSEMQSTFQGSTTDGQKWYTWPTGMKEFVSLRVIDDSESRKLHFSAERTFDGDVPYPEDDTEDRPHTVVWWGDFFELYPIPDDAYTMQVRCAVFPTDMSSLTGSAQLTRKDSLLLAVTAVEVFEDLAEFERADRWDQRATSLMQEAVRGDQPKIDWVPKARPFRMDRMSYDPNSPWTWRRG